MENVERDVQMYSVLFSLVHWLLQYFCLPSNGYRSTTTDGECLVPVTICHRQYSFHDFNFKTSFTMGILWHVKCAQNKFFNHFKPCMSFKEFNSISVVISQISSQTHDWCRFSFCPCVLQEKQNRPRESDDVGQREYRCLTEYFTFQSNTDIKSETYVNVGVIVVTAVI